MKSTVGCVFKTIFLNGCLFTSKLRDLKLYGQCQDLRYEVFIGLPRYCFD